MSDKVTIKPKQLLIFLGGAVTLTFGLLVFFVRSSDEKAPSVPAVKSGSAPPTRVSNNNFLGEKGVEVKAVERKVYIDEGQVSNSNMPSYNFYSEKTGKTIYFFIVKASDGTYRAAANACEVCFAARKGFTQVGGLIRCENCRVTYPRDKIALEKGGCNPGPIDKDVKVEGGRLVLDLADVENVAYLF